MDAFFAAIGKLLSAVLDAIKGKPVAEPSAPAAPGWSDIERRENEEAAKRREGKGK